MNFTWDQRALFEEAYWGRGSGGGGEAQMAPYFFWKKAIKEPVFWVAVFGFWYNFIDI
jgi:hypothetical protein